MGLKNVLASARIGIVICGLWPLIASAQSIEITNPSFEIDPIQGTYAPNYEIRTTGPTGWTYLSSSAQNGLLNGGSYYSSGVDGSRAAFIRYGTGPTQQTLTATLQANTTYTLTASVGTRTDTGYPDWGGYQFTLGTNSDKVVGSWVGANRNYTKAHVMADTSRNFTTGSNPLGLGEPLRITISQAYVGAGSNYIDFDNIRLTATAVTPHPDNTPIDVVILSGQSNAHGWGANVSKLSSANAHYATAPSSDALLAYKQKNLPEPAYSVGSMGQLCTQGAGFDWLVNGFGPELSLGTDVANGSGRKIAIIKYAVGSASLYGDFNKSNNQLYPELTGFVAESLQQLRDQGYAPNLKGLFWNQGESDCASGVAADYGANMTQLVNNLRTDLSAADLKFFLTEINPNFPNLAGVSEYVAQVNQGMTDLAAADSNVYFISTGDIANGFSDGIHYSANQQITIGQRYASAYLAVPEPTTMALLVTGLLSLLVYARRRRTV